MTQDGILAKIRYNSIKYDGGENNERHKEKKR